MDIKVASFGASDGFTDREGTSDGASDAFMDRDGTSDDNKHKHG